MNCSSRGRPQRPPIYGMECILYEDTLQRRIACVSAVVALDFIPDV